MRKLCILLVAAITASPASAKPPRAESPVPANLLSGLGFDAGDEAGFAAANAHPLGTLANPVRVGGPEGERAYLARLRCGDGSVPAIGARSSAGVGAFGSIANAFPIECGAAAPGSFRLVTDMYHSEHREERAPPGLRIDGR